MNKIIVIVICLLILSVVVASPAIVEKIKKYKEVGQEQKTKEFDKSENKVKEIVYKATSNVSEYSSTVRPRIDKIVSISKSNDKYIIVFGSKTETLTISAYDYETSDIPPDADTVKIIPSPINKLVKDIQYENRWLVYVNRDCLRDLHNNGSCIIK